ncbi:MAG: sulfite exporter TauE/SafE family protein [Paracoccaceae bacterium]|nr:sulfite exporter TauE/SafE family protein [Paracoccaceae bacterium]MDE3239714.1 sulfite exporter TauE/SafE family protein [Paracoccaceae bacterium]
MHFDLAFFAVAIPAVLFAGVSKGGFAGGGAFAATPILALVIAPGHAVGLMLPLLMMMDVATLRPYWGKWDRTAARLLLIGAVPGIALGAAIYRLTNPNVFKLLIGAISIGFVAFQMARQTGLLRIEGKGGGTRAGLIAGFGTGFTSFIANAGSPPAAVYMLLKGVTKTQYQATNVIVFWVVNLIKFIPFLTLGIATHETLLADLVLAPVALIGAWLGVRAHHAVPEKVFFAFTYVMLVLTGVKLIHDALI